MGLVHTKTRNRIAVQRVHKMVMVKMDLKRRYLRDSARQRLKRKFDELHPIQNLDTISLPVLSTTSATTTTPGTPAIHTASEYAATAPDAAAESSETESDSDNGATSILTHDCHELA